MMEEVILEENIALRKELERLRDLLLSSKEYDAHVELQKALAENMLLKVLVENKMKRINELYEQNNQIYKSLIATIEIAKGLSNV